MAVKVAMPKLGLVMVDGVVVKWIVEDGKPVKKGHPVCVIMSKKITYEVVAPADGILRHVAKIKDTIPVTMAIAYITAEVKRSQRKKNSAAGVAAVGASVKIMSSEPTAEPPPQPKGLL